MKTIGSYELKTHLARLLARVMHGETIGITKHGELIARIIPAQRQHRYSRAQALKHLRAMERVPLRDLTIRDLIEEGR